MRARPTNGTLIALAFAAILALGVLTAGLYKAREAGQPPVYAHFALLEGVPANATVHDLDFRAVHTRDSFLEDHLNTALDHGTSAETDRLRVEQMRSTVRDLAGVDDAIVFVGWEGRIVQVEFSGLP